MHHVIDAQDQASAPLDIDILVRDHIGTYRYLHDQKHLALKENEKSFLLEKALSRIQYWRKRAAETKDLSDLHDMLNRPGLTNLLKTFDAVINLPLVENTQHLPLTISLMRRDSETALALLEAGAHIKKTDIRGVSVMAYAITHKVLPFAEQVIRKDDSLLYEPLSPSSPVFSAICSDPSYMPLMQSVIESTAKINDPRFCSYSLMAHALASNNKLGVLRLLEHGSFVDMSEFPEDVLSPASLKLCREMLEYQDSLKNKLSYDQAADFFDTLIAEKKVECSARDALRKLLRLLYITGDDTIARYKVRQLFESYLYGGRTAEELVPVPMIASGLVISEKAEPEAVPVPCVKSLAAHAAREPLESGLKKDSKSLFVHSECSAFKRV